MKEDKDISEKSGVSKKKKLSELSDDDILQGFKHGDARIVKEYFYGYCRVAYCIYDKQYSLRQKPGMDFHSLVHEYYLYLSEHDFKPLEDRKPTVSLKTWMVNGFRFLILDKLKEVVREHRFESFEARQENRKMKFDVTDDLFEQELYHTIEEVGNHYYGRDSKNAIILKMLYIEGFKGKDVAVQLGMSAAAVTQRCQKMMHDVVIPYFKEYFNASDYESHSFLCGEMPYMAPSAAMHLDPGTVMQNNLNEMKNMEDLKQGRVTPQRINSLKENEVFVFGSNLAGMHGGGAARAARLHFGAVMGQGVGIQGQSYAIPTMQGGVDTIRPYVDDFIAYACQHPDQRFLVTPIGCGIAGFEPEDIAPLFGAAREMKNISLPECFWEVIG
jgi:DNA-directed RNA polymerase specialized sigma24 family protein